VLVSLDTNILIDEPMIVFDKTRSFVLSFTVIRELDNLKRNPDLKRAAQAAIKNIWIMYSEDNIVILNVPDLLGESPDEKIIQDTKEAGASILSNDIAVRIIAKAHGVDISAYEPESQIDYDYKGYQEIDIGDWYTHSMQQEKEFMVEEFTHATGLTFKENEYFIVHITDEKHDIWKNIRGVMYRVSQKMGHYTAAGIHGVQPKDAVQMCVLDAVFDPVVPLTIIDGELGTGKTMLSLMAALATVQGDTRYMFYDQVLITASPESINKNMYTGFKPGETENKLGGHLGGFKSNLKFLLDPRNKEKKKKKDGEPALKPSEEAWLEFFEIVEIDEIQGTSIHHKILLVDEWQKLDADTLKMVVSRASEGAKVVLMGDTSGQVYGLNRGNEGFKVLYDHLGEAPEMNFIKLENIYRSDLAEFVAKIFKDV